MSECRKFWHNLLTSCLDPMPELSLTHKYESNKIVAGQIDEALACVPPKLCDLERRWSALSLTDAGETVSLVLTFYFEVGRHRV